MDFSAFTLLSRDDEIALVAHALMTLDARDLPLTREQHAVRNLGHLRAALEHRSSLAYFDDARRREHAHRLPADAQQIGADAFSETLHSLVLVGGLATGELAWDNTLLDLLGELEEELLALEDELGSLWTLLAVCIAARPDLFQR